MEIFYAINEHLRLKDFGILIPQTDHRSRQCYEFLKNSDKFSLKTSLEQFNLDEFTNECASIHCAKYISRLQGEEKECEREVMKCFELVDELGRYNRYNPLQKSISFKVLAKSYLEKSAMTLLAAKSALSYGVSYHLGGGYHHAMTDRGRGFCLINDMIIAARILINSHSLKKVWIVDVDVHKGDGSAQMSFNDPCIQTLSIHMARGWPLEPGQSGKEPWFIPSTLDIPIEENQANLYCERLSHGLEKLLCQGTPELVIIAHGSDPYEKDELGSSQKLNLSLVQMLERDQLLFNFFKKHKIPQCYTMAGGYGKYSAEPYIQFFDQVIL